MEVARKIHGVSMGALGFFTSLTSVFFLVLWHLKQIAAAWWPAKMFKAHSRYHKMLVIGDGLAAGFGDGRLTPGILSTLQNKLIRGKPKLKHTWTVHNVGSQLGTSADWLPGAPSFPCADSTFWSFMQKLRMPGRKGHNLWTSVFDDVRWNDAEVAVLMLGNFDDLSGYVESVQTVMKVAEALVDRGLLVLVVSYPLPLNPRDDKMLFARARNQRLSRAVEKFNEKREGSKVQMKLAVDVSGGGFRRSNLYTGNLLLNSTGYQEIATCLFDECINDLVAVEWAHIKKDLTGS